MHRFPSVLAVEGSDDSELIKITYNKMHLILGVGRSWLGMNFMNCLFHEQIVCYSFFRGKKILLFKWADIFLGFPDKGNKIVCGCSECIAPYPWNLMVCPLAMQTRSGSNEISLMLKSSYTQLHTEQTGPQKKSIKKIIVVMFV